MRRRQGFTLLEVLFAFAIFVFVAAAAIQTMANCDYLAASAERARQLRVAAEWKLGEFLTFEKSMDEDTAPSGDFSELGEEYRGFTWKAELADPTAFGPSSDADGERVFDDTEEETTTTPAAGSAQPGAASTKGKEFKVRRIVLRVAAPEEGGTADSVELLIYTPPVVQATGAKK